jgi:hypothetical protein
MDLPGEQLKTQKMPGHWVLARLGKRVLRPGGMGLTLRMLRGLQITSEDDVVEFAPGMGVTAKLTLKSNPSSYTAIERDEAATKIVRGYLQGDLQRCVVGNASETGLPSEYASVVYGEAMLTMQPEETKRAIAREAFRLLKPRGRFGIHEMCFIVADMDQSEKAQTARDLTGVVHHGVRPLTIVEWCELLESEGFEIQSVDRAPMGLLEPGRLIRDEGLLGAMRFAKNLVRDAEARPRVLEMRSTFRRNRKQLGAIAIIARKP